MAANRESIYAALDAEFERSGKVLSTIELQKAMGGSFSTHTKHRKGWLEERGIETVTASTPDEVPADIKSEAYSAIDKLLASLWDRVSGSVDSTRVKALEADLECSQLAIAELAGLKSVNAQLLARIEELSRDVALARAGVGVTETGNYKLQLQQLTAERDVAIAQLAAREEELLGLKVEAGRVVQLQAQLTELEEANRVLSLSLAEAEERRAIAPATDSAEEDEQRRGEFFRRPTLPALACQAGN